MCHNPVQAQHLESARYTGLRESTEKPPAQTPVWRCDLTGRTRLRWCGSAGAITGCTGAAQACSGLGLGLGCRQGGLVGHHCGGAAGSGTQPVGGIWTQHPKLSVCDLPLPLKTPTQACVRTQFINVSSKWDVSVLFLFLRSCRELGE